MSNTRLTLLWENMDFFSSFIMYLRVVEFLHGRGGQRKGVEIASIVILGCVTSESEEFLTSNG